MKWIAIPLIVAVVEAVQADEGSRVARFMDVLVIGAIVSACLAYI